MGIVNISIISSLTGRGFGFSLANQADTVYGSRYGDNIFVDSQDTVYGGSGYDKASYFARFAGESAVIGNFSSVEEVIVTGDFSYARVIANAENNIIRVGGLRNGSSEVYAGLGHDGVFSNASSSRLFGEGGNDSLISIREVNLNGAFVIQASDDYLDGGEGVDTLNGGLGNDTYVVDNVGDVITELANQGTDTVLTTLTSYDLNTINNINLENLSYTGSANFTGLGNALNNVITGNVGNDTLNGGLGADALIGGLGNDTYVVDNVGDVITELANQGTDTVLTTLTSYDLNATNNINLENLSYTGSANFTGLGNALDNVITSGAGNDNIQGNAGNDTIVAGAGSDMLFGGAGDDVLKGGLGADVLFGGLGADVFRWSLEDVGAKAESLDKIADFDMLAGGDKLDLRDLLVGELGTVSSLDNYLHFDFDATNRGTIVSINVDGGFADGIAVNKPFVGAIDQQIQLSGVNLIGDFATDAQVIQNLLAQQKLITDIA